MSKLLHVDRQVGHALRTVHDEYGSGRVRQLGEFGDGVDCAEHIRHVYDGDDFGPRPDPLFGLR